MPEPFRIAVVSDIHYASAAEQARGDDHEFRDIHPAVVRAVFRLYRHTVWMRHPLRHNAQLDRFLAAVGEPDLIVANGDYTCGTGYVGVSDEAAMQSAREVVTRLRTRFGNRVRLNLGDHELGKLNVSGHKGGLRLRSWRRCVEELGLQPFWRETRGDYELMGVASTLLALPVFAADMLAEERPEWERLRDAHRAEIRAAFETVSPRARVLLFCHDPTALAFLWEEDAVRARLGQIEATLIGHLHSPLYLWPSRVLAGMPVIRFLGHTVQRMSTALNQARRWRPFRVRLCPSLAGIELLKDGGFLTIELDLTRERPARFEFHPLPR
ncbi:MAG: metallophosphoesterase [Verrucomicrobiales bacterium]|nr:metallophosphoesterase [Verrucomicrobiales bacterium]